jgi:hypothetical protein
MELAKCPNGSEGWYLAPTYRQAKAIAWKRLIEILPEWMRVKTNETELVVEIKGGYRIAFKGCDNYDAMRGGGPAVIASDEHAFSQTDWWESVVQPALADKMGRALFVSTPRGRNHFWQLWKLGMDHAEGWESWNIPTSEVGTVHPDEIERQRGTMPYDLFQQEWGAVFLGHIGVLVPEFVPKLWPEGNLLAPDLWQSWLRQYRGNTRALVPFSGMDYGRGPKTVHLWTAADGDGRCIFYDEFVGAGMVIPGTLVMDIRAREKERDNLAPGFTVLDRSAWRKESTGQSIAEQLARAGLPLIPSDSEFDESVLMMRTMCRAERDETFREKMPRLMVVSGTCHVLQHQLCTLEDRGGGHLGEARLSRSVAHDAFDAARYALMSRSRAAAGDATPDHDLTRLRLRHGDDEVEHNPYSGVPFNV